MTLNEERKKKKKKYRSIFHWLSLLVLKLYGTSFVPATLEFSAVSVATS